MFRTARPSPHRASALCFVSLLTGAAAASAAAAPPRPWSGTTAIADGELAARIERAVAGARRRLEQPACQHLLEDFANQDGVRLREVDAAGGASPEAWLSRMIFRDGRATATCARAAAFTGPGSRVVFICPKRFTAVARADAELIVIHEMLHTLGLGELPPTPGQIDRAVARRCGG